MTTGVVLNNSSAKQSHGFSKQQRFPEIKNATISVAPNSYPIKSDFDKMKTMTDQSFKVKE